MTFRQLHPNIKIRIYVMFAFGTVQATTMPFMAIYFSRQFGLELTGSLLAATMFAGMMSGAWGGYAADRFGRRKLMILSEFIFLLSYVWMAIANSPWYHSAAVTFAAFLMQNLCWGVYGPVDDAMILDVTNADSRQYVFALFYWLINLTMAVGTSIGAVFFNTARFFLFASMSVVLVGTLLTTIFFIQETHHPHATMQDEGILYKYRRVLSDRPFLLMLFAGTMTGTVEMQLTNYIGVHLSFAMPPHVVHLGQWAAHFSGLNMVGFLQTENTLIVVLSASMALVVAQRWPDGVVLALGIGMNTVGYAVMCLATSPWILGVAMLVATLGEVLRVPVTQAYMGDLAPPHARSSYLAATAMTFGLSRVLASMEISLGAHVPAWTMGALTLALGVAGFVGYTRVVPIAHARRQAECEHLESDLTFD